MDMNGIDDESDFERDQEEGQEIGEIQRRRIDSQDIYDDSLQFGTE